MSRYGQKNNETYFWNSQSEKAITRNPEAQPAAGGELHQIAGGQHPALTTNQGVGLSDNQNSLKANPRGPVLLEDFILREKITHFDHERIPERIVHARATGVHGYFELTLRSRNTPPPEYSPSSVRRRRSLHDCRPSQAVLVRWTRLGTYAGLR